MDDHLQTQVMECRCEACGSFCACFVTWWDEVDVSALCPQCSEAERQELEAESGR